ncbi:MAG: DUF2283 domain-containing protein [Methanosarcinales archaeon]|nr:DUF2283 domain-containing protein [Methanosarcinales archaeon]
MKVIYSPDAEILTLILREMPPEESDEISEGLIIGCGKDNKIVSIEMLDASDNVTEPQSLLYEIKGRTVTV